MYNDDELGPYICDPCRRNDHANCDVPHFGCDCDDPAHDEPKPPAVSTTARVTPKE